MSNKPAPLPNEAPVSDPHDVHEIFATELNNVQIGAGVAVLTFTVLRPIEGNDPRKPLRSRKIVVSRLAMPIPAVNGMIQQLMAFGQAIQQHQTLAKVSTEKAAAN